MSQMSCTVLHPPGLGCSWHVPETAATAAAGHATDPGTQCPAVQLGMRCSRDIYHPGAHVSRPNREGERGMSGWAQSHVEVLNALAQR